jgi:outer membrane biosynthesis protein TonB
VLGHAPSDEAIPAVRDERFEATDAHRLRTRRRLAIVGGAFAAIAIVIILVIAKRGSSSSSAPPPPAPTTAAAPPLETPAVAPPSEPPPPAEPTPPPVEPPDPPSSTNTTPLSSTEEPRGTRTGRTSSGRVRTQPGKPGATTRDRTTADDASPDDGTRSERARAAYKVGNEALFAGDTSGAIRAYRESASLGYAAGYRGLGLAYAQAGDRANAREALETYLKRSPNARDADLIRKRIAALK